MPRLLALALLMLLPHGAAAQPWPSQPVRVIVPASPGSSLDVIARVLGDKLRGRWNQPVVIEDKAGAGGMLGMTDERQEGVAIPPMLRHRLL
jgi:tripartite-type tricarboxylate transporter receptor subunit TctC